MPFLRSQRLLLLTISILAGCASQRIVNPSFPITVKEAEAAIRKMRQNPRPLQRPVVVFGGRFDFGPSASYLAQQIKQGTGDERVDSSTFMFASGFDCARSSALKNVVEAFPEPGHPGKSMEIDAVGISMGGLIARAAAIPDAKGRHLRIKRLFTIATPHRGAKMANFPVPNGLVKDMRHGSTFLKNLDTALKSTEYPIYPYVRLDDMVVGPANASPLNQAPWWVEDAPFQNGHISAHHDPRIIADILRHLRSEEPFSNQPATPLPEVFRPGSANTSGKINNQGIRSRSTAPHIDTRQTKSDQRG